MSRKSLACKIVLLGEGGVGKTSLRRAYLGESFDHNYSMTIGADFAAKRLTLNENTILANIWDLAGQSKFRLMRESYYRGLSGALLVFDITRRETYEKITDWIKELKANNGNQLVPLVLIGNKSDLRAVEEDTISFEEGNEYAEQLDINVPVQYIETSAKTGEKVEKAFEILIKQIFHDLTNTK